MHVFDVENHEGTPVYVHAKVCVVDDVWASVGSDNFNRRSWTHDSELSSAVLDTTRDEREPRDPTGSGDGARVFARDLRLRLAREHTDRDPSGAEDADLLDPAAFVATLEAAAEALDAWYAGGRVGPRPRGRLRRHEPEQLTRATRLWATPIYRLVDDPDGRPLKLRLRKELLTTARPVPEPAHVPPRTLVPASLRTLVLCPPRWAEHERARRLHTPRRRSCVCPACGHEHERPQVHMAGAAHARSGPTIAA